MANLSAVSNSSLPLVACSGNQTAKIVVKSLAYAVIIVVALTANCLIGAIVVKTKSMRTINYLIVNMAMSDIILSIFAFPRILELTEIYVGYWLIDGPLGLALCKIVYFLQDVSTAVSIQSLVLIAIDRFGAVVFPLHPPIVSSKRCPYFILCAWVVAMAIHSPYFFARKLVTIKGRLQCLLMWNEAFGVSSSLDNYYVAMFLVLAVIPFALMAIVYAIIIFRLKSQKMPGGESINAKEQEKRAKRERNVLQMAIAIVLGFALCWAPFNILAFLNFFVWEKNQPLSCGFQAFQFFAFFMAYANCAVNPCICFIFSGNYRQGLKNIFDCCLHKCKCSCFHAMRSESWNVQSSSSKEDDQNITLASIA